MPDDWEDLGADTDQDGRFALRFEPPRAFQFTLDAKTPGYSEASRRWGEIPPGDVVDVGEVTLLRAGVIEGQIVDGNGNPLTGPGWMVYADNDVSRIGGRNDPDAEVREARVTWTASGPAETAVGL